jgi:type I restriction enzyme, R subunit
MGIRPRREALLWTAQGDGLAVARGRHRRARIDGARGFPEVLLKERLAVALRKLNRRDGQPWLDGARIARAIRDLGQAAGHRRMEVNQSATELLLKGTVAEGLPDWDHGRPQPVRFIDFENPANNDFLVINQFKVELTSGRGHVIPDAVLFVNGIPLVVAEFMSPGIQNPLQEAINQLLRYSNQRRELFPTLYTENEGVERLFHTNQLLIASDFFEARAATIGAPPEAYLERADTIPVPLSTVAGELGVLTAPPKQEEAAHELAALGPSRRRARVRRSSSARRNSARQRCVAQTACCRGSRS